MKFSILKLMQAVDVVVVESESVSSAIDMAYKEKLSPFFEDGDVKKLSELQKSSMKSAMDFVDGSLPFFVAANFQGKYLFVSSENTTQEGANFKPSDTGYSNPRYSLSVIMASAELCGDVHPDSNGKYTFKVSFTASQSINSALYYSKHNSVEVSEIHSLVDKISASLSEEFGESDCDIAFGLVKAERDSFDKLIAFFDSFDSNTHRLSIAVSSFLERIKEEMSNARLKSCVYNNFYKRILGACRPNEYVLGFEGYKELNDTRYLKGIKHKDGDLAIRCHVDYNTVYRTTLDIVVSISWGCHSVVLMSVNTDADTICDLVNLLGVIENEINQVNYDEAKGILTVIERKVGKK